MPKIPESCSLRPTKALLLEYRRSSSRDRRLPTRREGLDVSQAIRCTCGHTHEDVAALRRVGWQPTGDGSFGLLVNCSRCGSTILATLVPARPRGDSAGLMEPEVTSGGSFF